MNLILPDPALEPPYHVMFLLHGLSDDHTIWCRRTSIERYVEGLPMLVVMPNTDRGFYIDAVEGHRYGTAIGVELPNLIRRYFPVQDRWSVTGLSMGGYGAFRLALGHPETFVSAVSHSGALTFGHAPWYRDDDAWKAEFRRVIGDNPVGGPNDLFALVDQTTPLPKLRFDCGEADFLLNANREFHAHLADLGIDHEYEEFPGDHNWEYWDTHVRGAIAFHRRNLGF